MREAGCCVPALLQVGLPPGRAALHAHPVQQTAGQGFLSQSGPAGCSCPLLSVPSQTVHSCPPGQPSLPVRSDVPLLVYTSSCVTATWCHIMPWLPGVQVGVRDLVARGKLRIVLRPLLDSIPVIGAVTASFLGPPTFSCACMAPGCAHLLSPDCLLGGCRGSIASHSSSWPCR